MAVAQPIEMSFADTGRYKDCSPRQPERPCLSVQDSKLCALVHETIVSTQEGTRQAESVPFLGSPTEGTEGQEYVVMSDQSEDHRSAARSLVQQWFRRVLDKTGYSPYRIAKLTGLSRSNLSRHASGESKSVMSLRYIRMISDATGIPAAPEILAVAEPDEETEEASEVDAEVMMHAVAEAQWALRRNEADPNYGTDLAKMITMAYNYLVELLGAGIDMENANKAVRSRLSRVWRESRR